MTKELADDLRKAALEIAAAGHAGWGNACTAGADAIEALQARVVELDRSETQLIQERDEREEVINALCDAVLGTDRYEWSSMYSFDDAVEEVQQADGGRRTVFALDAKKRLFYGHILHHYGLIFDDEFLDVGDLFFEEVGFLEQVLLLVGAELDVVHLMEDPIGVEKTDDYDRCRYV